MVPYFMDRLRKKSHRHRNGILFPKLFSPTVRKKCSSHREKLLNFETEGREFATFLRLSTQTIY